MTPSRGAHKLPAMAPLISVVVSTRDRPERLARLLTALELQTLDGARFEVIVVDNGTGAEHGGGVEQRRAGAARRSAPAIRVLRPATQGARRQDGTSAGARRVPPWSRSPTTTANRPGWLDAARPRPPAPRRDHPGRRPARSSASVISTACSPTRCASRLSAPSTRPATSSTRVPCSRSWAALTSASGPSRRRGHGSRLACARAGHTAVFAPDALVHHAVVALHPADVLRRAGRWSAVVARVRPPPGGARDAATAGWFWNVWHYLMWRRLLSLPAPRWLRRLVLARHACTLAQRAREAGSPAALPAAVPFLPVHDAVECVAIARGALRIGHWSCERQRPLGSPRWPEYPQ